MAKNSGELRINNLANSYHSYILLTEALLTNQKIIAFANQESQTIQEKYGRVSISTKDITTDRKWIKKYSCFTEYNVLLKGKKIKQIDNFSNAQVIENG